MKHVQDILKTKGSVVYAVEPNIDGLCSHRANVR
jgi:hypothetical protein